MYVLLVQFCNRHSMAGLCNGPHTRRARRGAVGVRGRSGGAGRARALRARRGRRMEAAVEPEVAIHATGGAIYRCPFDLGSHPPPIGCVTRCMPNVGMCIQGNNGGDTHVEELRFAYDFSLPVATPILAAADGEVAAVVTCFRSGSRSSKENRARANYVAVRHAPGVYSRYYHLRHRGSSVSVGQRVVCGQPIGLSGNTGFSGSPHLHWDVVDVLPTETATMTLAAKRLTAGGSSSSSSALTNGVSGAAEAEAELPCVAACFSGPLPAKGVSVRGAAVWAEPASASGALTNAADAVRGAVVLINRCARAILNHALAHTRHLPRERLDASHARPRAFRSTRRLYREGEAGGGGGRRRRHRCQLRVRRISDSADDGFA